MERPCTLDEGPGGGVARFRAVWACGFVCLGLIAGHEWVDVSSWWLFGAGAVAGALALVVRAGVSLAVLCAGCVALGWGYYELRVEERGADSLAHLLGDERRLVEVEGVVVGMPRRDVTNAGPLVEFAFREEVTRLTVEARRVRAGEGWVGVSGRLWVRVDEPEVGAGVGDRVRVKGFARGLRGPMNPGEDDVRLLGAERGIAGSMMVERAALVERVEGERGWMDTARWWPARVRAGVHARTREWLEGDSDGRALLRALLLGEKDDALEDVRDSFARTGVAHVLAISGLHLAILAGAAVLLVRMTGERPLGEPLAAIGVVAAYWFIVPAGAPIVRAGVMVVALVVGRLLGRRHHPVTMLAIAALVVLAWRPLQLFSPGFQLSFGIVLALVTLTGPLRDLLFGEELVKREPGVMTTVRMRAKSVVAGYLLAWAVSVPLVMHHFGYVSVAGIGTSFVVVPVVGVLLVAGFALMAVGAVAPGAAELIGGALARIGDALVAAIGWVDGLPGAAVVTPPVSMAWAIGATGAIAALIVRGRRSGWREYAGAGLALVWLVAAFVPRGLAPGVVARVDMLSVGDGTCILLRSGREALLYDCGSRYFAIGRRTIPEAARALGAWRLPDVVVSHANTDHYSGLPDAARALGVRRVLCTDLFLEEMERDGDGPVAMLGELMEERGVGFDVIGAGDVMEVGACRVEVLSPARGAAWDSVNDSSLVLRVVCPTDAGERVILLCGDIERDAMEALLDAEPDLRADVMELPHHGSARPAAFAFVEEVDPRVVLQSTGPRRLGDERWDEVKAGREWRVTAAEGAVWAEVYEDGGVESGGLNVGR